MGPLECETYMIVLLLSRGVAQTELMKKIVMVNTGGEGTCIQRIHGDYIVIF